MISKFSDAVAEVANKAAVRAPDPEDVKDLKIMLGADQDLGPFTAVVKILECRRQALVSELKSIERAMTSLKTLQKIEREGASKSVSDFRVSLEQEYFDLIGAETPEAFDANEQEREDIKAAMKATDRYLAR